MLLPLQANRFCLPQFLLPRLVELCDDLLCLLRHGQTHRRQTYSLLNNRNSTSAVSHCDPTSSLSAASSLLMVSVATPSSPSSPFSISWSWPSVGGSVPAEDKKMFRGKKRKVWRCGDVGQNQNRQEERWRAGMEQ